MEANGKLLVCSCRVWHTAAAMWQTGASGRAMTLQQVQLTRLAHGNNTELGKLQALVAHNEYNRVQPQSNESKSATACAMLRLPGPACCWQWRY